LKIRIKLQGDKLYTHIKMYQETEKPSKARQWQERSDHPIASRPMTPQEIIGFMKIQADSYKCDVSEISYEFTKIQDENDSDRDDCLWLTYKMKCVIAGKPGTRDIFRIKLPIPEEVRRAGEMARKQQAQQGRRRAIMPPQAAPEAAPAANPPAVAPPTVAPPTVAPPTVQEPTPPVPVAPKVRRPAVKRK
jgi:hypothetical protein